MTFTSHGYHIPGTRQETQAPSDGFNPFCGGIEGCNDCSNEAYHIQMSVAVAHAIFGTHPIEENTQMETTPKPELGVKKFSRRTFDVDAVQVTEENFEAVAAWCGGRIVSVRDAQDEIPELGLPAEQKHISVEVARPLSRRQTEAYVGDWILYASKGYKVYTNRPFQKNFVEKGSDAPQELFVTNEEVIPKESA